MISKKVMFPFTGSRDLARESPMEVAETSIELYHRYFL